MFILVLFDNCGSVLTTIGPYPTFKAADYAGSSVVAENPDYVPSDATYAVFELENPN